MKKKHIITMKGWKRNVTIGLVTVIVVMCLRIFLFASFRIPSHSMEPTLLPGDFILMNKLVPGPRMDWLYLFKRDGHRRIAGYRPVERGDIIVFNPPYLHAKEIAKNMDVYYIKRCVGVPGDWVYRGHHGRFQLKDDKDSIEGKRMLYIPRKGDRVLLDSTNIKHYEQIISYEIKKADPAAGQNSTVPGEYHEFEENYYIVLGDNSSDSEDSRFWGLLPEGHIVGKASYIWRSVDPGTKRYRWRRFFKSLDSV